MALSQQLRDDIESYLIGIVETKLAKYERETSSMPFQDRLLGTERIANYSFTHSVSTTLGMSAYEQIGQMIASANPEIALVEHQYELSGCIDSSTIIAIDSIVHDLRVQERTPNQLTESREIFDSTKSSETGNVRSQKVDLFVTTVDDKEFYFDLKTAKPNRSSSEADKRRMLTWLALRMSHDSIYRLEDQSVTNVTAAIAMPYNPYAPDPYDRWTLRGIFDYGKDLLVGEQFWDLLGGSNTYVELLEVFQDTGLKIFHEMEQRINRIVETWK